LWLKQHHLFRPVLFHSAAKLKAFAKSLNPVCDLEPKVTQSAAQSALTQHLYDNPMASIDLAAAATEVSQLTKKQKLMRSFISCGFLPKLATEQRSDTRRGLDLEGPMAKELLRDSHDKKRSLKSLKLFLLRFVTVRI
jgi:hypothetical protein